MTNACSLCSIQQTGVHCATCTRTSTATSISRASRSCSRLLETRRNNNSKLKPVILETPNKHWFGSIQTELEKHGYQVLDRSQVGNNDPSTTALQPPMLVYEVSGSDTVHTIREYLEQGIVRDPARVCALLTSSDGLEELQSLQNQFAAAVGCVCSSDIHDRALEWVRQQCLRGFCRSAQDC